MNLPKKPFNKDSKIKSISQYSNHSKGQSQGNRAENFPLQLKGTFKRYQSSVKQNIKSIINYEAYNQFNPANSITQNCHFNKFQHSQKNYLATFSLAEENALIKKILTNNKLANNTYQKSIVPFADPRSQKARYESVKTFKQSRPGSGVNYLMAAHQKQMYTKPQKRHVEEFHAPKRQNFGKRCIIETDKQSKSDQIVQCLNENISNENLQQLNTYSQANKLSKTSSIFGLVHSETCSKRISNDIHSLYLNKKSLEDNLPVQNKYEMQNVFRRSVQLGFQHKKNKQIGIQKMKEIMGTQDYSGISGHRTQILRNKRDDWRRSTIVIQ